MNKFDVTVIGAGPGGYVAAIKAAQSGANVAIIERKHAGGTCLNWGCIPTKTMVASAEVFEKMKEAKNFGLSTGKISFDWEKIVDRKDSIVKTLRNGISALLKSNKITIISGTAKLKTRNEIEVTNNQIKTIITSDKIILATGSESAKPGFFPFDGKIVLDSKDLLDIKKLPKSIIIVGGGVIGCEFASILNSFGVKVTVVEMLERLLPLEDKDISKAITTQFKKVGIEVKTGVAIENVKKTSKSVSGKIEGKIISADMMLVGVGRSLNTTDIGLEEVGVKTEKNAVIVNEFMQTTVANIYAIGDITNKLQLAHIASSQGIVAAENATGKRSVMNYKVVPGCIFTAPEIGTVGMTEAAAKESVKKIKIGKFFYAGLGKAMAIGETAGFYKIISDEETGEILGVHIFGAHATDIIAEAALAIQLECTVEELGKTIHAHPTLAEGVMEAAHAVHGECIHMPARK